MAYYGILTVVAFQRSESTGKMQLLTYKQTTTPSHYEMNKKVVYQPNQWRAFIQEGVKVKQVAKTLARKMKKDTQKEINRLNTFITDIETLSELVKKL